MKCGYANYAGAVFDIIESFLIPDIIERIQQRTSYTFSLLGRHIRSLGIMSLLMPINCSLTKTAFFYACKNPEPFLYLYWIKITTCIHHFQCFDTCLFYLHITVVLCHPTFEAMPKTFQWGASTGLGTYVSPWYANVITRQQFAGVCYRNISIIFVGK